MDMRKGIIVAAMLIVGIMAMANDEYYGSDNYVYCSTDTVVVDNVDSGYSDVYYSPSTPDVYANDEAGYDDSGAYYDYSDTYSYDSDPTDVMDIGGEY